MITIKQLKYILGILALVGMFIFGYCSNSSKKEYRELKSNYELTQDSLVNQRIINDSIKVANKETYVLDKNTLNILFKDVIRDFEQSTGKDIKNLKYALKTQINGKDSFFFYTKDTIYMKDSLPYRGFKYEDSFNSINGAIVKDGVFVNIERRLYLTSYTYNTRKKEPWYKPWKWGKKLITDVRSDNPKDSVVSIKSILIEK